MIHEVNIRPTKGIEKASLQHSNAINERINDMDWVHKQVTKTVMFLWYTMQSFVVSFAAENTTGTLTDTVDWIPHDRHL